MSEEMQLRDGVAVDFGGTKISAARVHSGEITQHRQTETVSDANISQQIDTIAGLLSQLSATAADRIGVAVTGRVDREGNWFALNKKTLSQIDAVPLRAMLSQKFGRDVSVLNDATAAVIGENLAGAGKGCSSLGYITVSTGVGGGFIINGQPLVSATGLAGHVGFTTSRHATQLCGSGRDKTVESIAGGKAIARRAEELGYSGMTARAVFEAHLQGQDWAGDIITQSAQVVAELCANLKSLLDPDLILLGGSIGLASGYIDTVRSFLEGEPEVFRPQLAASALGANAALVGVLAATT